MHSKRNHQTTEWKKIFANDISDKGLTFKIDKEFNSNKNKQTTQLKNGHRILIDIFVKKTYEWLTNTGKEAQHQ